MTVAAWIYSRKSNATPDQASIEDQEERGREACDEHGWTLAGVLREEVSASRFAKRNRERWEELLGLLRDGAIGILILWDTNRGDRTLASWAAFLDLCREQSARIYIVSHERLYDVANHRDWETLASDGVSNAAFSEKLSVVIKRGKAAARKKGREAGQTPYGYRTHYNPDTGGTAGWVIVPGEAAVVAEIIGSIGEHIPVNAIVRSLNERGIPARYGGQWTGRMVRYVAVNPAYAGLVRQPDGSLVGRQQQKDGAAWPPAVSREAWEKAGAVLSSRMTGPRPGGAKHLLTGLAQCECGGELKIGYKGSLACRNYDLHVNEEWLDEVVKTTICIRLAKPDARDLYIAGDDGRSARLRSELSVLLDRRAKFRDMASEGKIEPDALADIEAKLNPDIARKEKELGAVRVVPALAGIIGAEDTRAAWNAMTVQARREVVAAVTGVVVKKVGRTATKAARLDVERVVMDGKPQPPKRGPGGRPRPE
jgi:site-specific DNA recombinase